MSNTTAATSGSQSFKSLKVILTFLTVVWGSVVAYFAINDPSVPVFLGTPLSLILFWLIFALSRKFQQFLHSLDIVIVTQVQLFRILGLGFFALSFYNILPNNFALTAGLGDVIISTWAFFILLGLVKDRMKSKSLSFKLFHIIGFLDFLLAVYVASTSAITLTLPNGLVFTGNPAILWPMIMVPAFLIPLFSMAHFTALIQAFGWRKPGA